MENNTNQHVVAMTMDMLEDFSDIRKEVMNVSDERFSQGLRFALLISEGKSRALSYVDAFGDSDNPTRDANNLLRSSWVGKCVDRMISGNHIFLADKHITALNEMFDIGMSSDVAPKVRVDALKFFAELTKKPEALKIDIDTTIHIGKEMSDKIDGMITALSGENKMITQSGEIIEVKTLD